ncbi:cell cycle protein [Phycisphaera mikurensis NBRC 102666]|uniref:Probable peptidoglycan glycosyltransferase FtsW n=2 Tax=Phycisphaera TaxID=666508 RepID=I0ICG7_PHYMF|nr:cell cycle protein [Phycisphaera mikurensis NBRC 102666]
MAAAAGLLVIGVVMVRSAGMEVVGHDRSAGEPAVPAELPFAEHLGAPVAHVAGAAWETGRGALGLDEQGGERHLLYAALAIAAMLLGSRLDVEKLAGPRVRAGDAGSGAARRPPVLLLLALTLAIGCVALTFVPGLSRSVNGSSRWLWVGPISFQPSELVKWTLVPALAWWCAARGPAMKRFGSGLLPALALLAVAAGMVLLEDLGTGVLIGGVALALLLAGGARWWHLGLLAPLIGVAVAGAIATSPYRVRRLTAFLDPWADPRGTGYHPIQSLAAFADGGLFGRGLGNGTQKFHLPEDTTDFIFPIFAQELGIAGAAVLVGLYLLVLWIGLSVAAERPRAFPRLFALGVLATIGAQAATNLAVTTVVVPTKGIALPLVSAGGTGWVLTAFMIGLVAGLEREGGHERGREAPVNRETPPVAAGAVAV